MNLHTKNGVPLHVSGESIFGPNGNEIGRIHGAKVYGPNGRYVGTITGGRLVYRSVDSAGIRSTFMPKRRMVSPRARSVPFAVMGDEPHID